MGVGGDDRGHVQTVFADVPQQELGVPAGVDAYGVKGLGVPHHVTVAGERADLAMDEHLHRHQPSGSGETRRALGVLHLGDLPPHETECAGPNDREQESDRGVDGQPGEAAAPEEPGPQSRLRQRREDQQGDGERDDRSSQHLDHPVLVLGVAVGDVAPDRAGDRGIITSNAT